MIQRKPVRRGAYKGHTGRPSHVLWQVIELMRHLNATGEPVTPAVIRLHLPGASSSPINVALRRLTHEYGAVKSPLPGQPTYVQYHLASFAHKVNVLYSQDEMRQYLRLENTALLHLMAWKKGE